MFRKFIALFLFGFWLLPVQSGLLKNEDLATFSNGQKLVKPHPSGVEDAIKSQEYRQKAPTGPISARATAPHPTVNRDSLQRNREISEHLKKSFKIYKLNRVFLI